MIRRFSIICLAKKSFFFLTLSFVSCAKSTEKSGSANNLLLQMESVFIEKENVIKNISGKIVIKPSDKNLLVDLNIGDRLNDSDIIYMSEGSEIELIFYNGVKKVISQKFSKKIYVVKIKENP